MKLFLIQPTLRAHDSQFNLEEIEALIASRKDEITCEDIILLPERFTFEHEVASYRDFLKRLVKISRCTIVGGSQHGLMDGTLVNTGIIVDGSGNELGSYSKLRPYFNEKDHVSPAELIGEFSISDKSILVLICADFWYSDILLRVTKLPDIILVPALSVSRKSDPEYSRSLWRHLAISRAYEFGAFVGISDWSADSVLPKYRTCGVGGLADPTQLDPAKFFQKISTDGVSIFNLDFDALEAFRADRRMRGFFWK